ncbi:MAG: BrnT family toxin [Tunicatimonas sp.]|uniref:BrnT family toxin n=1 Tax=Tunicatimonas sp. TaxID=1940096 RepID=UPI003C73A516
MEFEWDEQKNQINIVKHGYDFKDVSKALLKNDFVYTYPSSYSEENRTVAICPFVDHLVAIIYTLREDKIRIISIRKARKKERQNYEKAEREDRQI